MITEKTIEDIVREYEARKMLTCKSDNQIFTEMAKDINEHCINCEKQPCQCHLIPMSW